MAGGSRAGWSLGYVQSGAVPLAVSPNPLVANSRAPRHSRANVDGIQFQCSRELWMRWAATRFPVQTSACRLPSLFEAGSGHNAVVESRLVWCGGVCSASMGKRRLG